MEVATFWIAVASVIIMVGWFKTKGDAEKHQTFRTIVEKTGTVDESQLKLLLDPPSALLRSMQIAERSRGTNYRTLRVRGTVVMFVAGGVMLFSGTVLGMLFPSSGPQSDPVARIGPAIGMGLAGFLFFLGLGLFFAARFVEKPASESDGRRIGSTTE